jgi:cell division protease FtsH
MSEDEKRLTAYHEGGHALVALSVPASDPVHKATIIPRGRALGLVMRLPEGDRHSKKFIEFTSDLAVAMGGRVAEELVFGKENITSGASSDIEQATRLARAMVTRLGYSDELGTVAYGDNQEEVFLGMSMGRQRSVSEATSQKIDAEIRRLVHQGYEDARKILTDKREQLEIVAQALLEYETLSGDEIIGLLNGKEPIRDTGEPPASRSTPVVPSAGKPRPKAGPDAAGGLEPQPQA